MKELYDMTDDMKDMLNDAKSDLLTQSERASLRNTLQLYMLDNPARAPLFMRALDALARLFGSGQSSYAHAARLYVPAALSFVLVVGISTSYAAEGALPGSPLYSVKVHINEKVQGSLASSESAKARWNTELVTRRLEEAELLAASGALTPLASAELQSQISVSTAGFNASVAELSKTEDAAEVAAVQSELEASLSGHEEVLTVLAGKPELEASIKPILASISIHKNVTSQRRANAEIALSDGSDEKMRNAAVTKKQEASKKMRNVQARMSAQTNSRAVQARAAEAEQNITEGDAGLQRGEYGVAFREFQAASRAVDKAEVRITAEAALTTQLTGSATSSATSTSATTTQQATSTQSGN